MPHSGVNKVSPAVKKAQKRRHPNIIICGTPGTGKTSLASKLADQGGQTGPSAGSTSSKMELRHIDLSKYAVEHNLVDGWDEILNCAILDEDKVVSHLAHDLKDSHGGYILDYHSCDFIPEELVDLVVVLRTDNTLLYDRLKARGYPEAKISNNLECEIFQTILDEAQEAFPEEKVMELPSDRSDEQTANLHKLLTWIAEWHQSHLPH